MSLTEEFLKDVLIPPEIIQSPWDNQRFRVRAPTPLEAEETPITYKELNTYLDDEYDQGRIGSCVGHSNDIVRTTIGRIIEKTIRDGLLKASVNMSEDHKILSLYELLDFSAWAIYQWSREKANIPPYVEGSTNLGAMKALHQIGACLESTWPTPLRHADAVPEPPDARELAARWKISSYWQVGHTEAEIKAAIYGVTHPFDYSMPDGSPGKAPAVVALPIFDTILEADGDGIVPMPKFGDKLLGGHSTPYMGWDVIDGELYWDNQGSWGNDVGNNGRFLFPKNYPVYDVWIMHVGGDPQPPPKPCPYGNMATHLLNALLISRGRRGRFSYGNPGGGR